MILICAGSYSSGSTWVFNMARSLVARHDPDAASLFLMPEEGLLSRISPDAGHVVVKAHHLERELLALIRHADVRVVRTWREPRDAVASLMARFGYEFHRAFGVVQQSLVGVASIPTTGAVLDLRYEDGFTRDPETVRRIARLAGVAPDEAFVSGLFAALDLPAMQERTRPLPGPDGRPPNPHLFHPDTHWHAGHVRDGVVGRWPDTLDGGAAAAVEAAMAPLCRPGGWQGRPIGWKPMLFRDRDGARPPAGGRVPLAGADRPSIEGAALHLPAGHWRVSADLGLDLPADEIAIRVEAWTLGVRPALLAARQLYLAGARCDAGVEFDHVDIGVPVDFRITAASANGATHLRFGGVTLTWAGPSRVGWPSVARRIGSPPTADPPATVAGDL